MELEFLVSEEVRRLFSTGGSVRKIGRCLCFRVIWCLFRTLMILMDLEFWLFRCLDVSSTLGRPLCLRSSGAVSNPSNAYSTWHFGCFGVCYMEQAQEKRLRSGPILRVIIRMSCVELGDLERCVGSRGNLEAVNWNVVSRASL